MSITLTRIQCGTCGVEHAIPKVMHDAAYEEGGYWHCPNGHQRGYKTGEEKKRADEMRRERDLWKQRTARKDDEIARLEFQKAELKREKAAVKGQVTKLKNRSKAGVCPCCNRTFKQLAAHMKNKHPEYGEKAA